MVFLHDRVVVLERRLVLGVEVQVVRLLASEALVLKDAGLSGAVRVWVSGAVVVRWIVPGVRGEVVP